MQAINFEYLFAETNALKLLRDKRAALVVSFLKQAFANDPKSILKTDLERQLTDYLRRYDETELFDDNEPLEPGAELFDRYQQKARSLLREWEDVKNRYIKGDNNTEGQYEYMLTEHIVRAWQWLESLEKREFTGTRSRLNDIFEKLHRVVENGRERTEKERIADLESKKQEIDREIDQIKAGHSPYKPLTKVELTEEFDSLMEQVRALSTDFKSVEGRFERIRGEILKRQAISDESKGILLHHALDARDDLDSTPQGQSFNAFFETLRDPQRQRAFAEGVEELLQLLRQHQIPVENETSLRRMYRYLLQEAQPVLEANRRVADRIRRFIGEQNRANRQLLRQRLNEAKAAFIDPEIQKQIKPQQGIWDIETDRATINLPLEKLLRTEPEDKLEKFALPQSATEATPEIALHDDGALGLRVQLLLTEVLEKEQETTLKTMADTHGISDGLAEVLAYLNLLTLAEKHEVLHQETDTFPLEEQIFLQGPRVRFVQSNVE
jgi:hypothetical protein